MSTIFNLDDNADIGSTVYYMVYEDGEYCIIEAKIKNIVSFGLDNTIFYLDNGTEFKMFEDLGYLYSDKNKLLNDKYNEIQKRFEQARRNMIHESENLDKIKHLMAKDTNHEQASV